MRVAFAPRSRGNPFLPAYAGQKFLPPGIPLGTKLSAEPRTRRKAARTLSALNFPVCVPTVRACRPVGTFLTVCLRVGSGAEGMKCMICMIFRLCMVCRKPSFRGYHANHANHANRSEHAGYRNHANHADHAGHAKAQKTAFKRPRWPIRPAGGRMEM